jgi:dolichol-phosphate mannosyltransferase
MSLATPPTITLIVPIYNEAGVLAANLQRILVAAQPTGAHYCVSLLLIDDGSTDDTAQVLVQFCAQYPHTRQLRFTRNFGKEAAIQAGLEHASGDAVIVMDSDLQHPPHLIPHMVSLWQGGARVVEARKTHRGRETWSSKLLAAIFYRTFRGLAGLDLRGQSDFKLLDRQVVLQYRQIKEKQRFFRGLIEWMNYPSACIPFEVPERAGGQSGWSSWQLFRYAIRNITAFSALPLHFVSWLGALSLLVGLVFAAIALQQKINGNAVDGFTTVILLLIFFSGMLMLSLGIIGHYLARIHDEIKQRPSYILHPDSPTEREAT